jgi:hypothetical protein
MSILRPSWENPTMLIPLLIAALLVQPENVPAKTAEPPRTPPTMPVKVNEISSLTFDRMKQDWGEVLDTENLKAEIAFKNNGSKPVTIAELKPSCGCVRPTLRDGKKEYAPGEGGVIDLAFEPMLKQGRVDYHFTVRAADPSEPVSRIDVTCDVKPTMGLESPDGLGFGTSDAGVEKSLTFFIFGRAADFKATYATISAESGFSVKVGDTLDAEYRGMKIRKTPVTVTMKPTAKPGRFSHSVMVRHSDKTVKNGLWEVTVTGEILNDVRATPATIELGTIPVDGPFEATFTLTHTKAAAFNVTGSRYRTGKGPAVEFTHEAKPGAKPGEVIVTIKGRSGSRSIGSAEGTVLITTDVKGMPPVSVPLKVLVRPAS